MLLSLVLWLFGVQEVRWDFLLFLSWGLGGPGLDGLIVILEFLHAGRLSLEFEVACVHGLLLSLIEFKFVLAEIGIPCRLFFHRVFVADQAVDLTAHGLYTAVYPVVDGPTHGFLLFLSRKLPTIVLASLVGTPTHSLNIPDIHVLLDNGTKIVLH